MSYRGKKAMGKLKQVQPITENEVVEYAIYTRRSQEKDEEQKASIPQQLQKCFEIAQNSNFVLKLRTSNLPIDEQTIVEIDEFFKGSIDEKEEIKRKYEKYYVVTERKSAKTPYKRSHWRQLLNQINAGKVRGLLGYAPDRFARNLQEGGELIQTVERNILSLKFTNFAFENNAAGHMMLGIWFVFAEHYSKKLSEDSTRGIKEKTMQGFTQGVYKYGYIKNEKGHFEACPNDFPILKKAFKRKIKDKWSDERIAEEMMASGWKGESVTDKSISSKCLWRDTFYYGIWHREFKSGDEINVNLLNLADYNFQPLLSEGEFLEFQELLLSKTQQAERKRKSIHTKKLDEVEPLPRGCVIDAKTSKPLSFTLPNPARFEKKLKKLREKGEEKRLTDIVRPKQIKYSKAPNNTDFEIISNALQKAFKKIKITKEDYYAFLIALREEAMESFEQRRSKQKSIQLLINKNTKAEEDFIINSNFGKGLAEKERKIYEKKLQEFKSKGAMYTQKLQEVADESRNEIIELEAFYDTFLSLHTTWGKLSYVQKRKIAEFLLLNICIKNGKVAYIKVKEEFLHLFPHLNSDLVARVGIEPTNAGFKVPCLTTWRPGSGQLQIINYELRILLFIRLLKNLPEHSCKKKQYVQE